MVNKLNECVLNNKEKKDKIMDEDGQVKQANNQFSKSFNNVSNN